MKLKDIKDHLQLLAVILIAAAGLRLLLTKDWQIHFAALVLLAAVGFIEGYLIYKGYQLITNWYIPILPKKYDWPIAIGTPIAFIVKAILMWHNKETLTIWWVSGAIIISWIAAHLCSFERSQK